ncbi:hypothetical protein BCR44DRAFT_36454 [Catenaria anguillulae PL171]|uniref:Uncharacterized protein n=1 Tax=Catenaria anguillulae PL171 TaxID=765915 RepID=A0A1Y2HA85_9FUNG|nr:hypothetical protein BCR44DRAFT_36454 [Catenaria anguillulae PL171]
MSSEAIGVQFTASRDGRKAMLRIVESFRKMTYGASVNSTADYQSGYSLLAMHYKEMVESILPVINTMDSGDHESSPHYRAFNRVIINASRTDYVPTTLSAIELANTVVQTSALALNYKTPGSLTAQVVASVPEFRFLVDNLFILMEASKELPKTGIRVYHALVDSVEAYLYIGMVISFVILLAIVAAIYLRVTKAYFLREAKVHNLLLSVPKRMAATLVTETEEEIETFREVAQSDDGQELDLSLVDHRETVGMAGLEDNAVAVTLTYGASGNTSGSKHGTANIANGWSKSPRRAKFFIPVFACVILISIMIGTLFSVTFNALDVDNDMDHFLLVADLRFHARALRMCGREQFSTDHMVPTPLLIQYFRASLLESEAILDKVLDERNGLAHRIPQLMVVPRNCTRPNVCLSVSDDAPSIGFTSEIASAPFITEYRRMIDMGSHLVQHFLDNDARTTIRAKPDAYNLWLLVEAVCEDLVARCSELEKAIQNNLLTQLASAKSWILVAFILLILVSITSFGLFLYYGTSKLQRESEALVLLLHMIPAGMLKDKDMAELARFMESAGLTLLI